MNKRNQKFSQTNYLNVIADFIKNNCINDEKLNELFHASLFDISSLESEDKLYFTAQELENYVRRIVENNLFIKLYKMPKKCKKIWDRLPKYKHKKDNISEFLSRVVYSDILTRGILIGTLERENIKVKRKFSTGDVFQDIVIGGKETELMYVEIKRYLFGSNISNDLLNLLKSLLHKQPKNLQGKQLILVVLIPEEPFTIEHKNYKEFHLRRLEGISRSIYLIEHIPEIFPVFKNNYNVKVLSYVISTKTSVDDRYTLQGLISRFKALTKT